MSYNRRFTRRVAVPYSGSMTVNYPASEHGGSKTVYYDGTAYEDVEVDIHVDTSPFDASVANNLSDGLHKLKTLKNNNLPSNITCIRGKDMHSFNSIPNAKNIYLLLVDNIS